MRVLRQRMCQGKRIRKRNRQAATRRQAEYLQIEL